MKSGETNTDSHQGTVEGFEMGGSSGLGLIVKRVFLAGKWWKDPRRVRPMEELNLVVYLEQGHGKGLAY